MTDTQRRIGGRRAPSDKPVLRLGAYLTGTVPEHPTTVDHLSTVAKAGAAFGLYQNDQFGDCGPTSVANSRILTTAALTPAQLHVPTQDNVFDLYRRSGNPGFDPATDADDNGVDMKTMLSAAVKGGIGGVKALGFAAVDTTKIEEVRAATSIFGFLLWGLDLDQAQDGQTASGTWDYVKGSPSWGGHAVLGGSYSDVATNANDRYGIVTWGEVVQMTDAFIAKQAPEAYVVIWPEHLGTVAFQQGVDVAALAADYQAITGRPFPAQVPAPVPAPAPQPAPAPVPAPVVPTPAPVQPDDTGVVTAFRILLDELVRYIKVALGL